MSGVALGVMARAPVAGACKSRLSRGVGAEAAARLYEAMIQDELDALGTLRLSRAVLFAAPEHDGPAVLRRLAPARWEVRPQVGSDLGERLGGALLELQGAEASLLVGSDSPTIPLSAIAAELDGFRGPRRVLLGPSRDGGYYLLGVTTLELGVLRDIPWSSASVLAATRQRCEELGLAVTLLPESYDIDEAADLELLARDLARDPGLAPRTATLLSAA